MPSAGEIRSLSGLSAVWYETGRAAWKFEYEECAEVGREVLGSLGSEALDARYPAFRYERRDLRTDELFPREPERRFTRLGVIGFSELSLIVVSVGLNSIV